jgi:two-component system response regulator RegX3
MPRILLVEDEDLVRAGLVDVLVYHGFEVDAAADGTTGLQLALTKDYNLVILDVMLPGLDGFSICQEIRQVNRLLPIVMLTAKDTEDDVIFGLSLGADDYIAKPFSIKELVLRIEAILRRADVTPASRYLTIANNLRIDTRNLTGTEATANAAHQIEFTRREVDILCYLNRHCDRPVPRGELLQEVWGYARAAAVETRTVDIHIAKLRRKIEPDPKNPCHLITVRGEGYRLLGATFNAA